MKAQAANSNGSFLDELREQNERLVEPLVERLAQVQAAIETREEELLELRKIRTATASVLRSLAPERLPETKKRQPRRRGGHGATPALDHMVAWLNEHGDEFPDGVSAPQVVHHESWDGASRAQVTKMLTTLHEQGRITLTAQRGMGGAKFYKAIA